MHTSTHTQKGSSQRLTAAVRWLTAGAGFVQSEYAAFVLGYATLACMALLRPSTWGANLWCDCTTKRWRHACALWIAMSPRTVKSALCCCPDLLRVNKNLVTTYTVHCPVIMMVMVMVMMVTMVRRKRRKRRRKRMCATATGDDSASVNSDTVPVGCRYYWILPHMLGAGHLRYYQVTRKTIRDSNMFRHFHRLPSFECAY